MGCPGFCWSCLFFRGAGLKKQSHSQSESLKNWRTTADRTGNITLWRHHPEGIPWTKIRANRFLQECGNSWSFECVEKRVLLDMCKLVSYMCAYVHFRSACMLCMHIEMCLCVYVCVYVFWKGKNGGHGLKSPADMGELVAGVIQSLFCSCWF